MLQIYAQHQRQREVYVFNRSGRKENLQQRINENQAGYSCAYYGNLNVPVLQFMIIDKSEVIFLSNDFQSKFTVRQPQIVSLFIEYYEAIWKQATPIKTGNKVNDDVVRGILGGS